MAGDLQLDRLVVLLPERNSTWFIWRPPPLSEAPLLLLLCASFYR